MGFAEIVIIKSKYHEGPPTLIINEDDYPNLERLIKEMNDVMVPEVPDECID